MTWGNPFKAAIDRVLRRQSSNSNYARQPAIDASGLTMTEPFGCESEDLPIGLLQKYTLGKLLYKRDAVSVRWCETRERTSWTSY